MIDLVLASSSPRRASLLRQINLSFRVEPASIQEHAESDELPAALVTRLAQRKVQAVLNSTATTVPVVVLGADTVVVLDGEILGKPKGKDDAMGMLMRLSGRRHRVLTAVSIGNREHMTTEVVETIVVFRELTVNECERYWFTGEPADKAGGYGIQGLGAIFVASIRGSYSNVVGLPLMETANGLRYFNIDCLSASSQNFD